MQGLMCMCTAQSTLKEVLCLMMNAAVSRVVCTDDQGRCLGIVSIKDIVWYYIS